MVKTLGSGGEEWWWFQNGPKSGRKAVTASARADAHKPVRTSYLLRPPADSRSFCLERPASTTYLASGFRSLQGGGCARVIVYWEGGRSEMVVKLQELHRHHCNCAIALPQ